MHCNQQHAIITGGSSGIGEAIAQWLARKGAHISIIARTQTTLASAQSDIEAYSDQGKNTCMEKLSIIDFNSSAPIC